MSDSQPFKSHKRGYNQKNPKQFNEALLILIHQQRELNISVSTSRGQNIDSTLIQQEFTGYHNGDFVGGMESDMLQFKATDVILHRLILVKWSWNMITTKFFNCGLYFC